MPTGEATGGGGSAGGSAESSSHAGALAVGRGAARATRANPARPRTTSVVLEEEFGRGARTNLCVWQTAMDETETAPGQFVI
eukprot:174834-Prymnesium_polylepis.1